MTIENLAEPPEQPSEELLRVWRGEMTEEQYVQIRVEAALEHVKGRVSNARLALVRRIVTEKLRTDPVLLATKERIFRRKGGDGG